MHAYTIHTNVHTGKHPLARFVAKIYKIKSSQLGLNTDRVLCVRNCNHELFKKIYKF